MSEKLSELKQVYTCDICSTEQCLTPTKKNFSREGKNNEGDLIVYDYFAYFCCRDNNASSYCQYCLEVTKPKEKKIEEKPVLTKVISKVKEVVSKPIEEVKSSLEEKKKALLEKMAKDQKLLEELEK